MNDDGLNPLLGAYENGHMDVVQYLVQNKADGYEDIK